MSSQESADQTATSARIVYGYVDLDGNIISGSGDFTSKAASGDGIYQILFDTPFTKTPSVVATAAKNNSKASDAKGKAVATNNVELDNFYFIIQSTSGNNTNNDFSFIAMGV